MLHDSRYLQSHIPGPKRGTSRTAYPSATQVKRLVNQPFRAWIQHRDSKQEEYPDPTCALTLTAPQSREHDDTRPIAPYASNDGFPRVWRPPRWAAVAVATAIHLEAAAAPQPAPAAKQ
ncbi:hypothetical protein Dda_7671 [Drechslerella dactyloides]|uniref:Uncharacterized protein n=1 Tax=Drechslerella dactyloides TaxID=74499 RepID=A0AAD6IT23_DREDA|nr:hypothetical protein Dda_7671 [Drechslerella dactyloides]